MKKNLVNGLLLVLAAAFFALSHPNALITEGLPIFAYVALTPLFLLARRVTFVSVWFYGLAYGALSYYFFGSWLAEFHPLGLPVVAILYGFQGMLLLVALKLAYMLCGRHAWIAQWLIWCAYDYLKVVGFSGFSYGNMGYTHWQVIPLLQFASIAGVWGLGALVTFPSAWISKVLQPFFELDKDKKNDCTVVKHLIQQCFIHKVSGLLWVASFILIFTYGLIIQKDYTGNEHKTVALIQPNSDPWKGGTTAYARDLNTLKRLTNAALAESEEIDFVVWSETAFVPSIRMHYQYREDRVRLELVNDLLTFIDSKEVPFVIGNGDTVRGYSQNGAYTNLSYNSVFLFRPGENVIPPEPEIYNKMHLVPFTESFPFEEQFPVIHQTLLDNDTHFWEFGDEATIFTIDGVSFGTPICFEDTFGYIGRRFTQNGAQAIVNLSNDSWSHSEVAQYQHLSMAVFRSVENRIPSIRATASGQTSVIDPNGKVTAMIEPFEEAFLIADFPVVDKGIKTLYTRWGDFLGVVSVVLAGLSLVFGLLFWLLKRIKKN